MEPVPRAGSEALPGGWAAARAAGLLSSSAPGLRASRRGSRRTPAGEGARARARAAACTASSRKAAGPCGLAVPRERRAAGGGAEPAGLSLPVCPAATLRPSRSLLSDLRNPARPPLARSLRPQLSPPRPPPPPTRRPEGTLPASPGRAHAPPKPITGRPGGRAAGWQGSAPTPTPPAGLSSGALGLTRPRGGSARRGGEEGCGCGLGLPS